MSKQLTSAGSVVTVVSQKMRVTKELDILQLSPVVELCPHQVQVQTTVLQGQSRTYRLILHSPHRLGPAQAWGVSYTRQRASEKVFTSLIQEAHIRPVPTGKFASRSTLQCPTVLTGVAGRRAAQREKC